MPSPISTYLIIGVPRGIGLDFAPQLLEGGATVIATCRDPLEYDGLQEMVEHPNLHVFFPYVLSIDSIRRTMLDTIKAFPEMIDVLINNTEEYHSVEHGTILDETNEDKKRMLACSALGPDRIIRVFASLIKLRATSGNTLITDMTSLAKSITTLMPKTTIYSASKMSLSLMSRHLFWEFKQQDIYVLVLVLRLG